MASDEAEHAWAGAADHDRRERIGFGFAESIDDLVMFAAKGRLFLCPESFDNLKGLFQFSDTSASGGKIVAISTIFIFFPASADTENEASAGEILERGGHLSQESGIAEGLAKDDVADVELRLQGSPVGEGSPRFQQGLVVLLDMINKPEGVDMVGKDGDALLDTGPVLLTSHVGSGHG